MTPPRDGEARETSGATTGGLLGYVRAHGGDDAVAQVLERAGVPHTVGDEASMLAAYAGHAAAALDLLMALEAARLEASRASALLELAHELAAASDAPAVADVVARALPRIVGCSRASMMLWDSGDGVLRTSAVVGMTPRQEALLRRAVLRPEDTPELVRMLTDPAPLVIDDSTSSPVLQGVLRSIGSADVVAVPLLAGTSFLGVATAAWATGEAPPCLTGDVLDRLRGAGDQASTALQKARLLETVRHQATHDPLTGLPNRVLFLDRLEAALAVSGHGAHLGVLFCDLDLFKQVNDTLGHAAGDDLLRQVAARLRAAVRPGDTVGRLSGDEFAVLLPALARPGDAHGLAQRVSECFAEPFRLEGTDVTVGTSIGVALHVPDSERAAEQLLREADAAMYRYKQVGRPAPQARPDEAKEGSPAFLRPERT